MQLTKQPCAHTKELTPANLSQLTTSGKDWKAKSGGNHYHARAVLIRNIIHTLTPRRAAHADTMAIHYSRPLTKHEIKAGAVPSQVPQLPVMDPVSPLDVIEPVRGRRLRRAVVDRTSSPEFGTATIQAPVQQPSFDFHPHAQSSEFSSRSDSGPRTSYDSFPSSSSSSSLLYPPPSTTVKKGRYYIHALSTEDKDALAHGEHNHNLKPYTPKDMVMHHESRKELVPRGSGTDKLRKMEAFAQIEQDKQHSQQALNQKNVRRASQLPAFRLTNEHGKDDLIAYHAQMSQSMYNLRTSSIAAPQPQADYPVPSLQPMVSRKFSFDEPSPSLSSHTRATSTGNYFSHRPTSLLTPPSSSFNASRQRTRSPLGPKPSTHQRDPSATFDAFLVPHKSGKGEAFRDTSNAKKSKELKKKSTPMSEPARTPVAKALRRFSKMPSMPSLKNRRSRRDLGRDGREEDGDVPPMLPLL